MPEVPVKESRLPELRLPELSRDDIIRSLSEIRRPDVDLSNLEWPKVDLSRIEFTREDLDKAILGVTAAARLVRPAARSRRLPLAFGFVALAGLATFALISRPAVRDRLARTAHEARRRAGAARSGPDLLEVEPDVIPGLGEAALVGIPIEPDAFADAADTGREPEPSDAGDVAENLTDEGSKTHP
jgi:hypothetical protein